MNEENSEKTSLITPPPAVPTSSIAEDHIHHHFGTRDLLVLVLIIGLLAGGASGYEGAKLALKKQPGQTYTITPGSTTVSENSAIIDVVKKSSPAVVSIIISQNLNSIYQSQSSTNPFFFDPFGNLPDNSNGSGSASKPQDQTPNYQETGAGSGFFVTSDGLILTNKHVVSDSSAKYTVLTNDGKQYDATVVAQDPVNDLALVKINISNAPTLQLADSNKIEIGQQVVAIGNSLGEYRNTVTSGIISGIGRNITAGGEGTSEELEGVLQTDAAINPGNSGGPLLNIFGDVVGVNTAVDQQGQLVGFAIPSDDAAKDLQNYQKTGKITKPFLGVEYVLITPALKVQEKLPVDNGAWVTSKDSSGNSNGPAVVAGSAADKAGIKDGDIITAVNGNKIDQDHSLALLMRNYNPGDTITLDILRSGKTIQVKAALGENNGTSK